MLQQHKTHWGRIFIVLLLVMALCATLSTAFAAEPSEASATDAPGETMVLFADGEGSEKGEGDAAD